jgi:N-terminal domain of galactosyltransferase
MRTVVLVPWRAGDPLREANWRIVRAWYEGTGLPVVTGDSDPDLPFNLSAARNRAAELAGDWDCAIVADADTVISKQDLLRGHVEALTTGHLVLPFTRYWPLNEQGQPRPWPERFQAGGVTVIPRPVWDELGGYDERFAYWGAEDSALLWAAYTLAGAHEIDGDVFHLWHPRPLDKVPADVMDAREHWGDEAPPGYGDSGPRPLPPLALRYLAALGNPEAMRALLAERKVGR